MFSHTAHASAEEISQQRRRNDDDNNNNNRILYELSNIYIYIIYGINSY